MKISIAMATYNGAKYIREQLDSILTQTIKDFELIICDDCSTDNTWDILQEYATKDSRIQIYRNEKNIGYRKNFEGLVNLCKGEYIAFCDQDDIWLENHLQVLYDNIGSKAICTANAEIIDGENNPMGFKLSNYAGFDKYFPEDELDKAFVNFYWQNPFPGCNMLLKKSFLETVFPIHDENIKLHDAYVIALACISGAGMNYVNKVTMLYRFHQDSVTFNTKKRFKSAFRCIIRKLITDPEKSHNYVKDRKYYCTEMLNKNINFTSKQKQFLEHAYKYHSRRNTFYGRLLNLLFDFKHFHLIYLK